MAETWPVDLPTTPLSAGYSDVQRDNTIRSEMGYGPAKVRRRSTVNMRDITYQYVMTKAQVTSLSTFYNVTLGGGVETYDYPNYIDTVDTSDELRFKQPPVIQPSGPDFSVRLFLEVMP